MPTVSSLWRMGDPNPARILCKRVAKQDSTLDNFRDLQVPCRRAFVSFAQGRNRFRGPNYFNTDFTIMKNTKIPRLGKAECSGSVSSFSTSSTIRILAVRILGISDAGFGQIFYLEQSPTGILGSGFGGDVAPRMIQLKAQLQF